MAYIDVTSTTTSSITVQLAGLDTSYSGAARTVYWYYGPSSAGTLAGSSSLSNGASSGGSITITGLSSGTTYSIRANVVNMQGDEWIFNTTASTTSSGGGGSSATVARWDWQSSTLNQNAKKALYGQLPASYFDSGVWNALVNKIRAVQIALGLSWLTTYATERETYARVGDTFSATMFNSALYNIHHHNGMQLGDALYYVSRGDRIYGELVIMLAAALNSWIVTQGLDSGPILT